MDKVKTWYRLLLFSVGLNGVFIAREIFTETNRHGGSAMSRHLQVRISSVVCKNIPPVRLAL